jgi:hypothetical protein
MWLDPITGLLNCYTANTVVENGENSIKIIRISLQPAHLIHTVSKAHEEL